jgi:uncharacterized protein
MKSLLAALAAITLFAAVPAFGATPTEITVVGTGTVSSAPNQAIVSGTVETNAATAADAVSESNVVYDRLVQAVQKIGIKREAIRLSFYSINYVPKPQEQMATPNFPQRYGYTVNRSFTITTRDVAQAGPVVDAVTSVDSTTIGGVDFGLTDTSAQMKTATKLAIADARAKAEALAAAAGLHIVGVSKIAQGAPSGVEPMMRAMAAGTPPPTAFDSGHVSVSADVTIIYLAAP